MSSGRSRVCRPTRCMRGPREERKGARASCYGVAGGAVANPAHSGCQRSARRLGMNEAPGATVMQDGINDIDGLIGNEVRTGVGVGAGYRFPRCRPTHRPPTRSTSWEWRTTRG